ncbi:Golgi-associated plant pathogenesis-related protein 1 [Halotydeus destructor]|nr:Golgi-associated plant pathogenesis-related protein 1 [Halotydeus destructor]
MLTTGNLINQLVDFAKKRAKTCAENGKLEHDPKGTGENLYWNSDPKPLDGTRAIGRWYAEVDKYDYDKPGFSEQTGHFTQLVWKKTTRVGCGQATSKHGLYMSCNYLSAGNVEGQYEKNVLKPKDDKHAKNGKNLHCQPINRALEVMICTGIALSAILSVVTAQTSVKDYTTAQFQQQSLQAHNKYRKTHGSPALTIDQGLVTYATKRARTMASTCKFEHDAQGRGENLYKYSSQNAVDGATPVAGWYNEIKVYNYAKPGFSMATGHFTQVVWKATTKVGCGQASSKCGTFVCCNYLPAGNMQGQFEKNVLKPAVKG